MSSPQQSVPDLLQRFVETPFVLAYSSGRFETNDMSLLASLRETGRLESALVVHGPRLVRLVRDREAPRGGPPTTVICRGPLRTIAMGMGTVVWVDAERKEILGFIGPDVSAGRVCLELLPLALKLLAHNQDLAEPESGASLE